MTVVTLTTDFSSGDHEAGVLKGVIWGIAPQVRIADLSHEVTAHDILEGALLLWRSTPYFPPGSIHVGVIDPGVGTQRRGLAGRLGDQVFVGPDNGLFTLVLERAEEAGLPVEWVVLNQPQYWLPNVSSIFHGRDIFSPVAAHLANGVALTEVGERIENPVRLAVPRSQRTPRGFQGQVIHIDRFGNLSTNLSADLLVDIEIEVIRINGKEIYRMSETFGDGAPGELVALIDSSGLLAVAIVNGSAAKELMAQPGDSVEAIFSR